MILFIDLAGNFTCLGQKVGEPAVCIGFPGVQVEFMK